jgi:hypothetical protein
MFKVLQKLQVLNMQMQKSGLDHNRILEQEDTEHTEKNKAPRLSGKYSGTLKKSNLMATFRKLGGVCGGGETTDFWISAQLFEREWRRKRRQLVGEFSLFAIWCAAESQAKSIVVGF